MTEPSATVAHPAALALVVSAGVTPYLAQTLRGVAEQRQAPAAVVLVDVTPAPDPGHARTSALRALAHRSGLSLEWVRVIQTPAARTLGAAVGDALARLAAQGTTGAFLARPTWLWLLHDDSAPEPGALAELLRVGDSGPTVAVVGSKQRDWWEPDALVSVGVTVSPGGRRFTGVEDGEIDQGQHDGREDVYAVGTAGMLVKRAVWEALGGPDPALGPYGDGLDLCRRARLAGFRVVVAPGAVVRHARAGYLGLRPPVSRGGVVGPAPRQSDPRRSFRARRVALVHLRLVEAAPWTLPLLVVVVALGALVRALARIVTKEPGLAGDEIESAAAVLARPGLVARARRSARATRRVPVRRLDPLRASWREVWQVGHDRRLRAAALRKARRAPTDIEIAERAALGARRRATAAALGVGLVAVAAVALGPLVVAGPLTGGALLPLSADAGALWHAATSSWVAAADGYAGPPDPIFLLVALLALPVGGSAQVVVSTLVLASVPLAGLSAWWAAGAATRSTALRAWAGVVWALGPALLLATGQGRLGAVLAHVALPWAALGVARALGVQARDVLPSVTAGAAADAVAEPALPPRATALPLRTGSPGAAAAAGLALAVAAAGAPVLLVVGLAALALLAALAWRNRRYLVLTAIPPLALLAPVLVVAGRDLGEGSWRVLVADPGVPLAADAGAAYLPVLGWPTEPFAWPLLSGSAATLAPLVAGGLLALGALAALVRVRRLRGVQAGWAVALVGLAGALLAGRVEVAVGDRLGDPAAASAVVTGWPGSGTSLLVLGLLVAVLVAADGMRERLSTASFGWRQVAASVLSVLLVLGPLANGVAWVWRTVEAREGGSGGEVLALSGRSANPVPALGAELQEPPTRSSVLALVAVGDDVEVQLWRGDGAQLDEWSTAVAARALAGTPGNAVLVGPDGADSSLAQLAATLAAGTELDMRAELAAHAVGVVVVPPAESAEHDRLVAHLDATTGLERVTENASGVVWRAAPPANAPANARVGAAGRDGTLETVVPAQAVGGSGPVPAGDARRYAVLAERADPGWQAWLDGGPLAPTTLGWRQAFVLGSAGGQLVVVHEDWSATLVHTLQAVVLGLFVLLALPLRRRRAEVG